MHKYICHSTVSFTYVTQPYRIVLKRECTAYNAFPIDLVIGTSRNRFATDSLEMGDRRDIVKILEMGEEKQRKSLANDKSLKDVVTYIHKKTASLALIVTLHVAWPKRVGIYSKLIKQDNKENIHHRIEN